VRLTTVLDEDYPLNLRWVWDRPLFLFYRGELRQLEDAYALAVVGTRNPSEVGRKRARRWRASREEGG
jgi:DNA processing protein